MKTRIVSAAVALVLAIIVLALGHTWVFNLAIAAITVGALYELFKAVGLVKYRAECCACFAFAAVHCLIGMVHKQGILYFINEKLYGTIFVLALLILYLKNHDEYVYVVPFTLVGFTAAVTYAMHTLISLMTYFPDFGRFAVVLTLAGAWLADSGAYFVGSYFSKSAGGAHKLCPTISPNKTVEGLVGGTVCNGVFLLIFAGVYGNLINTDVTINYFTVFIAGMLCSVIGLVGDLSASIIKRQTGIKDYGNIMPGHGGVMDRFDSVLTVAPFMYIMFVNGWLINV